MGWVMRRCRYSMLTASNRVVFGACSLFSEGAANVCATRSVAATDPAERKPEPLIRSIAYATVAHNDMISLGVFSGTFGTRCTTRPNRTLARCR